MSNLRYGSIYVLVLWIRKLNSQPLFKYISTVFVLLGLKSSAAIFVGSCTMGTVIADIFTLLVLFSVLCILAAGYAGGGAG